MCSCVCSVDQIFRVSYHAGTVTASEWAGNWYIESGWAHEIYMLVVCDFSLGLLSIIAYACIHCGDQMSSLTILQRTPRSDLVGKVHLLLERRCGASATCLSKYKWARFIRKFDHFHAFVDEKKHEAVICVKYAQLSTPRNLVFFQTFQSTFCVRGASCSIYELAISTVSIYIYSVWYSHRRSFGTSYILRPFVGRQNPSLFIMLMEPWSTILQSGTIEWTRIYTICCCCRT